MGRDIGPTVLLLHGWGSSKEHMRPFAARLQDEFRVILVDFPGHGSAPEPPQAWDMDAHADFVQDVLSTHAEGPVLIVGHSNGGRVALFAMARFTSRLHTQASFDAPRGLHRVIGLVLLAPSGTRRERSTSFHFKSWLARVLKAPFQIMPGPLGEAGLDWLRHSLLWRALSSSDYAAVSGVMRETFVRCVTAYLEEELPRVMVPTVILRGSEDEAISAAQVDTMVRLLPDAGAFEVAGAGHYVQLDAPDVAAAAVRKMASTANRDTPSERPLDSSQTDTP